MVWTFATPTSGTAQDRVPRFEPGDCTFPVGDWAKDVRLECGHLIVHEVRERPQGRTLRLAVVIVRAQEPSEAPPLVMLHGGPDGEGIRESLPAAAAWPVRPFRDIVIYDQRGAGLSEPRPCPELLDDVNQARDRASRAERAEGAASIARLCRASLKAAAIDSAAYGTDTNVADLIDLRRALGYALWDVYGVSYGGLLASAAMREDPDGIRSVVLSSPGLLDPVVSAERPLSTQRAVDRLFEACAAQPSCLAAFPLLQADLTALYDELTAKPQAVAIERGGVPSTISLDGERLLRQIVGQLTSSVALARLPALISELRRGDRMKAARLLVATPGDVTPLSPLAALVICRDIYGEAYRAGITKVSTQLRPAFQALTNELEDCRIWQERFANSSEYEAPQGEIPVLILNGEFDPLSRPEHARRLSARLRGAHVYEIPGEGHGQPPSGCKAAILFQFLDNPAREPDASCIAAMPRLTFATQLPNSRLTFVITATGPSGGTYTGAWEAEFPGETTITLHARGTELKGTVQYVLPNGQSGSAAVYDGRLDEKTLTFKAGPMGGRTITFTGTLNGDEIAFTRHVTVPPGAGPGGAGLFGVLAPRTFRAKRVN
jgi:pimeloyl-ACP methyl ester carboxylesterase